MTFNGEVLGIISYYPISPFSQFIKKCFKEMLTPSLVDKTLVVIDIFALNIFGGSVTST